MNTSNAAQSYLRTKILTAGPDELRLMLYDGAIKFCHQAKDAMSKKDLETSHHAMLRAQKIVLELSTSLDPEAAPEICDKLSGLYNFIYRRLVDANVNRDTAIIDEVLDLLSYERQTWELLMQKLAEQAKISGGAPNLNGARQTAISSLSTDA
jgi:flagellar protein FliS